jgi:hypothetical protein
MFHFENIGTRWDRLFHRRSTDPYFTRVVVTPSASFDVSHAPFELRYVIEHLPDGLQIIHALLSEGKGIIILRVPHLSKDICDAVSRVAKTQSGVVDPWLARLIFHESLPIVDSASLDEARRYGGDPYADARMILSHRVGLIRLSAFDQSGKGIMQADVERVERLNRAMEPLSASYAYHRLNECVRGKKIRFISLILRSIVVFCILSLTLPFSIVLSLSIVALADDVARLIGSLVTLRRSGYTKRQIKMEAFPYFVPLIVGILFSACAYSIFLSGRDVYSGFMFGLAVITFPLFTAIHRFYSVRSIYRKLEKEGKLFDDMRRSPTVYALYELKHDHAEWGLTIGSFVTPFFCAWIFYLTCPLGFYRASILVICSIIDVIFAILWRYGLRLTDRARFISTVNKSISQ